MSMFNRKYLGNKARSKRSEKRAAKIFGGRVQPASGAINRFDLKADVKSADFLVDDKTTNAASYSLSVETWRKLSKEAWMNNRRPAMRVEFTGSAPLYIIDEQSFLEYQELKQKKHDTEI